MDFQPPINMFGPPPNLPREVRVVAAANGYVVYLRGMQGNETIRIAPSLSVLLHILQEYFKTPAEVNDSAGTS